MAKTRSDPVIDEIREVRHRISARFDHVSIWLVAYRSCRRSTRTGRSGG